MSNLPPEASVDCPTCKRPAGKPCMAWLDKKDMTVCHPARRTRYLGHAKFVSLGSMWKQGDLVAVDAKGDFTRALADDEVIGVIENDPTRGDAIVKISPGLEKHFHGDRVQIAARARKTEPVPAPEASDARYVHVRALNLKPLNVIVGPMLGLTERELVMRANERATILRVETRTGAIDSGPVEAVHLRVRRWDSDAWAIFVTRAERLVAVDTSPDD